MNGKIVLVQVGDSNVTHGVVVETIATRVKGGEDKTCLKIITMISGARIEIERNENDVCEVTAYNTTERGDFLHAKGNGDWAENFAAELDKPEPMIPVAPVSTIPFPVDQIQPSKPEDIF